MVATAWTVIIANTTAATLEPLSRAGPAAGAGVPRTRLPLLRTRLLRAPDRFERRRVVGRHAAVEGGTQIEAVEPVELTGAGLRHQRLDAGLAQRLRHFFHLVRATLG